MWSVVSTNTIRSVPLPIPQPGNRESQIVAWSGGAFDPRGRQLLVFGGGDADYGGNEVMAFERVTGRWRLLTPPSTPVPNNPGLAVLPDGHPGSRHTYGGCCACPTWGTAGGFFLWSGAVYHDAGVGATHAAPDCWMLDLATATWQRLPDAPAPGLAALAATVGTSVWIITLSGLLCSLDLTQLAQGWQTRLSFTNGSEDPATMTYHPLTQTLYIAGISIFATPKAISLASGTIRDFPMPVLAGVEGPGLVADPDRPVLYGWRGGATVYEIDAITGATIALPHGGVTPTDAPHQGTYGRFALDATVRQLLVVNSIDEPVFAYQLPPLLTPGVCHALEAPTDYHVGSLPGKHVTIVDCPTVGKLLFAGGDRTNSTSGTQSYRQGGNWLDEFARFGSSNPNAGWSEAYSECATPQPKMPDFNGYAVDEGRGQVWFVPAQQVSRPPECAGETEGAHDDPGFLWNHLMSMDMRTGKWIDRGTSIPTQVGASWMAYYDSKTDRLYQPGGDPGGMWVSPQLPVIGGPLVGAWTLHHCPAPFPVRFGGNNGGWDVRGRRCYLIDTTNQTGYFTAVDLDTFAWTRLPDPPFGDQAGSSLSNFVMTAWDERRQRLLYWRAYANALGQGMRTAHIFDPVAGAWTALPVVAEPAGTPVAPRYMGRSARLDAFVLYGGTDPDVNDQSVAPPRIPKLFLLRLPDASPSTTRVYRVSGTIRTQLVTP